MLATLREKRRADVTIIDPAGLDQPLNSYHEAPIDELGGIGRMVNRNPGLVTEVFINGALAFQNEEFSFDFGRTQRFGQFLRANSIDETGV